MEFSIHQLEHSGKLISGFETLLVDPLDSSQESDYLKSSLRLNGIEIGEYDGTESFFDKVKEVGIKFYEYVKKFLKGIWDFFFSPAGEHATKKVDNATVAIETSAKKLPKVIEQQEQEVKTEIVENIDKALTEPVKFHINSLSDKYLKNKDGVFTDIEKAAKTIGIEIPDIKDEVASIMKYQDNVLKEMDGASRAKTGNIHGVAKTMEDAVFMAKNYKGLRNSYLTLMKKLSKPIEAANALTKTLQEKRNETSDHEKLYRMANKVTVFLVEFDRALVKAVNNCSRNVGIIADAFGSVYIKIDYKATEERFIKEMSDVEILGDEI